MKEELNNINQHLNKIIDSLSTETVSIKLPNSNIETLVKASNCYISITDSADEIVLKANTEGMLTLAQELIKLCISNINGKHYHLDECGLASECNKPMVITFVDLPK
ncbi:MAG: hypothetical protein FWG64_04755 [Firmicutes bacterium]|nr:hypothetical protein [Bacillota bacterium]